MNTAAWVLIVAVVSGSFSTTITFTPVYFQTKEACAAVAYEFNNGPEPKRGDTVNQNIIAKCWPTGAAPASVTIGKGE